MITGSDHVVVEIVSVINGGVRRIEVDGRVRISEWSSLAGRGGQKSKVLTPCYFATEREAIMSTRTSSLDNIGSFTPARHQH